RAAFDAHQRADRAAEAIWAIFSTLSEDADRRPLLIVARVASTGDDLRRIYLVKVEQHFDVRELAESGQRVRRELRRQLDARLLAAPEIILRMRSYGLHVPDRLDFDAH